jgi:hypothetical protein
MYYTLDGKIHSMLNFPIPFGMTVDELMFFAPLYLRRTLCVKMTYNIQGLPTPLDSIVQACPGLFVSDLIGISETAIFTINELGMRGGLSRKDLVLGKLNPETYKFIKEVESLSFYDQMKLLTTTLPSHGKSSAGIRRLLVAMDDGCFPSHYVENGAVLL